MKIAIGQINPVIADIAGNRDTILSAVHRAAGLGAQLVVFPEMATVGYPPMDLLENNTLIADNIALIDEIAHASEKIAVICGYVDRDPRHPAMLRNAAAYMAGGRIVSRHAKTLLPAYDVFDETRYFTPASVQEPVVCDGVRIGITICEDIWNDQVPDVRVTLDTRRYDADPVAALAARGIDLLVSINASPYTLGKNRYKWDMIGRIARSVGVPVLYANQVGGNDSLVFDGNSFLMDRAGAIIARARAFEEDLVVADTDAAPADPPYIEDIEEVRRALVLGLRDYVHKCGFADVIIGLSGGIDSALTAAIAAQALGPGHVTGITMPSMFSSRGSVDDSYALAQNLGIRIETIAIADLFARYREELRPIFGDRPPDIAEENIQARIRGNLLMAISNKFGSLLLTTGNKSELAMGYCTLYGDMSGGLAVISDLPKTMVYALSRHINREREIIPAATIEKPPSAELRENQKDEDSLPPYDILDGILERYIERRMSAAEIVSDGFAADTVRWVLATVDRNEYKRRQAPPGLKITSKAFGIGRRIPMAQRFRH
ncbi:MAG TPA: NAD+ synthase [Spirochaetota bacterium]|nr:NAD+ synthase [Spirochaetota bacterium]HNT09620.1 NAD+ synthase [Spirochaetota bacterium]